MPGFFVGGVFGIFQVGGEAGLGVGGGVGLSMIILQQTRQRLHRFGPGRHYVLSPLSGAGSPSPANDPRLTPWAAFFRPFGAGSRGVPLTHGLRRGLYSCAPSELRVAVRFGAWIDIAVACDGCHRLSGLLLETMGTPHPGRRRQWQRGAAAAKRRKSAAHGVSRG